jgi:hypothetical protein
MSTADNPNVPSSPNNKNDSNSNSNIMECNTAGKRMKANGYFLIGSILCLPPSIYDVIVKDEDEDEEADNNGGMDIDIFMILLIFGTLAYFANGVLEMRIAYVDHEELRKMGVERPPRGDLVNGGLFAVAAVLELLSVLVIIRDDHDHVQLILFSLSTHFYITNALLTLWLRNNADLSSSAAKLVRLGDFLFLGGAGLDLTGSYWKVLLADNNDHADVTMSNNIAVLWLISSIAWFVCAMCYQAADDFVLLEDDANLAVKKDDYHDIQEPFDPVELEIPTTKLSAVV